MKQFDIKRCAQYARYDLTLNRAFYRNMAIVTAAITVGIAILCFLFRWIGIRNIPEGMEDMMTDPYTVTGAKAIIGIFAGIMSLVYAGCFNHPLRSKQSRISVLTLPATTAEKFLWHTLLVLVGGFLLLVASFIVADGVNALLSLMIGLSGEHIYSLTAAFWRDIWLTGDNPLFNDWRFNTDNAEGRELIIHSILNFYALGIWMLTAYIFGNAVKYRYNIVWTTLALQALQFILTVLIIVFAIITGERIVDNALDADPINTMRFFSITSLVILVGTTIWMWWGSWRLYKKAQITSKLNR